LATLLWRGVAPVRSESNLFSTDARKARLAAGPQFPYLTEGELLQFPERDSPTGSYGLDRVALSFPLRSEPDGGRFGTVQVRQGEPDKDGQYRSEPTYGVSLDAHRNTRANKDTKAAVFIGATNIGGKWWGKVEFNPSRMVDPDGCELAPVQELEIYAQDAMLLADDYLARDVDVQGARVKRLDVARDFHEVRNTAMYVRGLQPLKRSHARFSQLYSDPTLGDAQTLFVGSGAGGVRLYDQHAAYKEKGAEEGSLRWELQARSDWVTRAMGSDTLGRMNTSAILKMAEDRWEWSRMGTVVSDAVDVVTAVDAMVCRHPKGGGGKRVCGCDGISQAIADRLLGQLVREAMGVRIKLANDTASSYERLKRELGVIPTAELFAGAVHCNVRGRLDWQSGVEVAA
jgi:hypothetical protein